MMLVLRFLQKITCEKSAKNFSVSRKGRGRMVERSFKRGLMKLIMKYS